jgi:hypothetical protein
VPPRAVRPGHSCARTSPAGFPSPIPRSSPPRSMSETVRPMRIVPPLQAQPPRRRRPGAAVALILIYASVFGAGLLWMRARSPLLRSGRANAKPQPTPPKPLEAVAPSPGPAGQDANPSAAAPKPSAAAPDPVVRRASLLSGDGLAGARRAEYARRLSAERCTCGCNLALRTCLAQDRACSRSPELAEKIRASVR